MDKNFFSIEYAKRNGTVQNFENELIENAEEEPPLLIKPITRNTTLEKICRWGIQSKGSGNHRILYTIHDYHKVVLMHHFDKQYNGDIKRKDIIPAEDAYFEYCGENPPKYPIKKG
ncbi:type II toxin-antitoxin system RelE/ParE family toxin [Salimicrobium flavidum]|uniref:Phage derived protein Gp49-like n=1 Tax=Salimicrobium flavidum TaxID=570947 RepID=A0A1N7KDA3_9BACI|nr:type II toxin-antitoxin system RelE/ParE family toxin [Salimicrobium flavidum]SIS59585.1 Phage derived protein Gp49-like [Salimicrobium flavidum]